MEMSANKNDLRCICQEILEKNGRDVADKARTILLEDPAMKDLHAPLEFISQNWRDPLAPAMMALSCEAVGGHAKETYKAGLALSLMNLSFHIWDDIIDKATSKLFKSTLFGKFGEPTAIIIGGLTAAKAFSILNQTNFPNAKRQMVNRLFWNLWSKMAQAEIIGAKTRSDELVSSQKKLRKIKMEALADMQTCLKLGAVIGNGSKNQIRHLGLYGAYLGTILELHKDFCISINLTLELEKKIENEKLPYTILWSMEHSEKVRERIKTIKGQEMRNLHAKEIVNNILDAHALDHVSNLIEEYTIRAKKELFEAGENSAIRQLQRFVEAQHQFLTESLPGSDLQ